MVVTPYTGRDTPYVDWSGGSLAADGRDQRLVAAIWASCRVASLTLPGPGGM